MNRYTELSAGYGLLSGLLFHATWAIRRRWSC
jgi:hypothetical protein